MKQQMQEIMRKRHSVRTYENREISNEVLTKIEEYIDTLRTPFTSRVRIEIVKQEYSKEAIKLGTYGVIKGASYYLVAACEDKKDGYIALGYAIEKVVLFCTSLGLGTCIMGGTFNKSSFAEAVKLQAGEMIAIVCPFGYESDKSTLVGSLLKKTNGKRKPFEEVFFEGSFATPLTEEKAGVYGEALEMVRIAPSAINKQPWRVVQNKDGFHFYLDGKRDMQKIDMGIALCHFHIIVEELGKKGSFRKINPGILGKAEYMISWIIED